MEEIINKEEMKYTPAKLNFDYEAKKKEMTEYVNAIKIPNSEKALGKLRRELNAKASDALKKALELDKLLSAPIKEMREQVKEIAKIAQDKVAEIDEKIAKFEEKRIKKLKDDIAEIDNYDFYIEYLDFNDKWLNKTYKFEDIESDIKKGVDKIYDMIDDVSTLANKLDLNPEQYTKRIKTESVESIKNRIQEDYELLNDMSKKPKATIEDDEIIKDDKIVRFDAVIRCPKSKLKALSQFAKQNGIKITQVKK